MVRKPGKDYYTNRHSCFLLQYHIVLINVLKTQTSRRARKLYGENYLKKYYRKPYFWTDSYFIATVSENSFDVVRKYIQDQGIR